VKVKTKITTYLIYNSAEREFQSLEMLRHHCKMSVCMLHSTSLNNNNEVPIWALAELT
jgi:hypothetical protein